MCTFTLEFLCIGGEFTHLWIKFGELMCQFCVCYSSIYNLYMGNHETIRNQLINYLTFISVKQDYQWR